MDDIYIYMVTLPPGINEAVVPCLDGYTIYISNTLPDNKIQPALDHALAHIHNHDFEKSDVQEIESDAHKRR